MVLKTLVGVALLLSVFRNSEQRECFSQGECKESFQITGYILGNKYECRKRCQTTASCTWFTFFERTSYCQLFKNCFKLDKTTCLNCYSGEIDCVAPELKCKITGRCQSESLATNITLSSEECLDLCQTETDCKWFTFDSINTSCSLYKECSELVGCDTCVSGNYKCLKDTKELEWHLIIGGAGSPNTVELYNWYTNQQCQLPNLPVGVFGHVAVFMEGVPVFCEAGANRQACFKMDKSTHKWVSIASLLAGVEYGKSVFVESHGWAVFGQLGNELQNAQLLPSLNSEWKEGPPLIPNELAHKEGQCIIQISEIKTGIIHDSRKSGHSTKVLTILDWSTMSYTELNMFDANYASKFPACAVLKDQKIALTRGTESTGMNFVQMTDSSADRERDTFQLPGVMRTGNEGLAFTQVLSINNGTELLLYGGQIDDKIFDGIYKFSMVTKRWMKLGHMLFPRAAHTVIPVQGITCPNN